MADLPLSEAERRRVGLLEEALAECLSWIRAQEIYDDRFDEPTRWKGREEEVAEVMEIVQRAEAALGSNNVSDLIGRSKLRPEATAAVRARTELPL